MEVNRDDTIAAELGRGFGVKELHMLNETVLDKISSHFAFIFGSSFAVNVPEIALNSLARKQNTIKESNTMLRMCEVFVDFAKLTYMKHPYCIH